MALHNTKNYKVYTADDSKETNYAYCPFSPFPRTKPPEGYFRLSTVYVDGNPMGYQTVIPRYRNRSIALEYSHDNNHWISTVSGTPITTSGEGIVYLRCPVAGNTSINDSSPGVSWTVGGSSTYYKLDGDIKVLLDYNNPNVTPSHYNCLDIWSNFTQINNKCIEANLIIPDGGDTAQYQTFWHVFYTSIKKVSLWKEGRWNNGANDLGEWSDIFLNSAVTDVQLNFKSWPTNRGIGPNAFAVAKPSECTFYIPLQLPEVYGSNRLPAGCKIVRYDVDKYGGGHE